MFHGHERKYAGVRSCNHANLHRVELCRNARPDTEVPEASAKALLSAEALLGQIEGDLVMGIFVRGLAGHGYRRKAVERAIRLICSVDWLAIGVGIASGEEFVGNVGGGGFKDFTALGDVTNIAARLTSRVEAGEILMDSQTYVVVDDLRRNAERRELELKGKSAPVEAFAIRAKSRCSASG